MPKNCLNLPKKSSKKPKTVKNRSIGTKNESSLHKTLKFRYAGPGGTTENRVGSYVADGINASGDIIEIQTGSFASLKEKIAEFSTHSRVKIIHPVALSKYIEVFEPSSGKKPGLRPLYRRKSPSKGSIWNLFDALVYAPHIPACPHVSIEIALVDITEIRIRDGKGSWRRKGVSIYDKKLEKWHGRIKLEKLQDYRYFVPFREDVSFTNKQLAEKVKITEALARKTLYVLTKLGVVTRVGKQDRCWLYRIKKSPTTLK